MAEKRDRKPRNEERELDDDVRDIGEGDEESEDEETEDEDLDEDVTEE